MLSAAAVIVLLGLPAGAPSSTSLQLEVRLAASPSGGLEAGLSAAGGRLALRMAEVTPLFAGGRDYRQTSGALALQGRSASSGRDLTGPYTEVALTWAAASAGAGGATIRTSARSYASLPRVAMLTTTVAGPALRRTNRSGELPIVGFPSVHLASTQTLGFGLWHGLWPDPVIGRNLSVLPGRPSYHDGPVVFTAPDEEDAPRLSLLLGPVSDPLNTVYAIERQSNSLLFGLSPRVESLPSGHELSVVAVLGDGVTDAVRRYGEVLRGRASSSAALKLPDPTLQSLSAWTDNGAFYFWNSQGIEVLPRPAVALPPWLAALRKSGVNVSTLQLDGWWMEQLTSEQSARLWPGDDWEAFLRQISAQQETPLMLYKAFFAEKYDLFTKVGCAPVTSPQGAHYPPPHCSRAFFRALFGAFANITATQRTPFSAFEIDFLSDHLLPTVGLARSATGLEEYFHGLASAAEEAGLPVQLCMPTAGIVLASAAWPAMTNGRVRAMQLSRSPSPMHWINLWLVNVGQHGLRDRERSEFVMGQDLQHRRRLAVVLGGE